MHDIECFIVGTWKRFINMHSILLLLLRFDNQFDKCPTIDARFVHYLRQHSLGRKNTLMLEIYIYNVVFMPQLV